MNPTSVIVTAGDVVESSTQKPTIGKQSVSLYFHVPFCSKKCDYCHFYVLPDNPESKVKLMDGFRREWELRLPFLLGKEIETIYFGGGTPSLLGADRVSEILQWINHSFPTTHLREITLEANPEEISLELMQGYVNAGINRVSMGIQTLHDPLLKTLGRQHSSFKALDAVHMIQQAGIKNITVDLMYDLPGQTLAIWKDTLDRVCELPIQHLSLYNLTIELYFLKIRKNCAHCYLMTIRV
jgi:oxygen-independent coproporphyrinogen-3 oxidase